MFTKTGGGRKGEKQENWDCRREEFHCEDEAMGHFHIGGTKMEGGGGGKKCPCGGGKKREKNRKGGGEKSHPRNARTSVLLRG